MFFWQSSSSSASSSADKTQGGGRQTMMDGSNNPSTGSSTSTPSSSFTRFESSSSLSECVALAQENANVNVGGDNDGCNIYRRHSDGKLTTGAGVMVVPPPSSSSSSNGLLGVAGRTSSTSSFLDTHNANNGHSYNEMFSTLDGFY